MSASSEPLAVVVLISGSGTNLQAIIDAREDSDAPLDIRAVISNTPEAYGLERARRAGIPTLVVNHRDYPDRAAFEAELMRRIDALAPDLVVLAGFMRILGGDFVTHYAGRMMNIHPSLLPRYPGLNTHARALDNGDHEAGATVHFVTAEVDGGPIIIQARVPVEPEDTPECLAARVLQQEHRIYPQAIKWFAQRRLSIRSGEVLLDAARSPLQGLADSAD